MRVARAGPAHDLGDGIEYRSTWERNIARYLRYMGIEAKYEPKRFYFPGKAWSESYLPDWRLMIEPPPGFSEVYIELKGWLDKKSIRRLRNMRAHYGKRGILCILIDEDSYARIENDYAGRIKCWERSSIRRQRTSVEQLGEGPVSSEGEAQ